MLLLALAACATPAPPTADAAPRADATPARAAASAPASGRSAPGPARPAWVRDGAAGADPSREVWNPVRVPPRSAAARCRSPELSARFARCRAATDEGGCRAAGGEWRRQGAAPAPSCYCPSGQDNCPCTTARDCLAGCRAPMAFNAARENRCKAVRGTCAPGAPSLGCWCWFGDDGTAVQRCSD
jgi:hypothetical protein